MLSRRAAPSRAPAATRAASAAAPLLPLLLLLAVLLLSFCGVPVVAVAASAQGPSSSTGAAAAAAAALIAGASFVTTAAAAAAAAADSDVMRLPMPGVPGGARMLTLGESVGLDHLGPMVVQTDGTLRRIANWDDMSKGEQETAMRVLTQRNRERLAALQAAGALPDPAHMGGPEWEGMAAGEKRLLIDGLGDKSKTMLDDMRERMAHAREAQQLREAVKAMGHAPEAWRRSELDREFGGIMRLPMHERAAAFERFKRSHPGYKQTAAKCIGGECAAAPAAAAVDRHDEL